MSEHGTGIEWTHLEGFKGETWNPVTGCSKVSDGCAHCYAEREFPRLVGNPKLKAYPAGRKFTDVMCHPERLDQPLRWRKPRAVFVNSMSDLFHPDVPDEFIAQVFGEMKCARQHIFMVLTKRPDRMRDWLLRCGNGGGLGWITHDGTEPAKAYNGTGIVVGTSDRWPLPNVWLGVSAEDQAANERITLLLQTPAAVRFVSVEPLLGPVDLTRVNDPKFGTCLEIDTLAGRACHLDDNSQWTKHQKLDWVICGGESGPRARPMHQDWARSVRDQCQAAGVPFFFKQWGEWAPYKYETDMKRRQPLHLYHRWPDKTQMLRVGKKAAGRLLDGREWNEFPSSALRAAEGGPAVARAAGELR